MNIKEIARLAGVSASTVSKIVNQKDDSISSETRERVLKLVRDYNYTPYASTASLQKTWVLGMLLPSSVSFDNTLDSIISTAQNEGYTTIVCNSNLDLEQELKNITALCKNKVDGIIWEPLAETSISHASYFEELNIPFITIGPYSQDSSAMLPYEELGYRLTQELINRKHENIACISTQGRRTEDFIAGYKKCLFDNQMVLDDEMIFFEFTDVLNYKINSHEISGVISSHYQISLEFYQLMNSLHYKVPEDLSLISLKSDFEKALTYPEISTYTVANSKFGSYLCRKIISMIEKSPHPLSTFSQEYQLDNRATIGIPFHLNSAKITVVGSINMDTYLNVAHLPHAGKTVSASTSSVSPGGKGINQSIGAARLGQRVTLIGNVGCDLDADRIYRILNENSVETLGVKRCAQTDTGKSYIFVDSSGDSTIAIQAGANALLTPEDIRRQHHLFENCGYCLLQSEIPFETIEEACRIAHKYGAKTILKPSACDSMTWKLLSNIDIIIPNLDELSALCSRYYSSMEEQAASMLECGIETVIITLKEQGCYVKTRDWEEYFPAADFSAVDTTGASDAFISALASYLLYGYTIREAVQIATYAAGFCILKEGVVPALIDKYSLEAHISQKEPELIHHISD